MAIAELFGILATVSGAVWFIAEKINGMDRRIDDRLDIIEGEIRQGKSEGRLVDQRIQRLEKINDSEIEKLNRLLTTCRLAPLDDGEILT